MTTPPSLSRSSGILLHVTSLPGPYGIGDLGPEAHRWIDWLAESGTRYWQILPLGPPGLGNSPYSSLSSHAGSIDMVSPDALVVDGLLDVGDLGPIGDAGSVEYLAVRKQKSVWIDEARGRVSGTLAEEFVAFREASPWLDDYTLFMALRTRFDGSSWTDWPDALRDRHPDALGSMRSELGDEIERHAFGQFLFYRQLAALRRHAAERGVAILGDVPLYVDADSADVWVNRELFDLEPTGKPRKTAGVPPDGFSVGGQRWESPVYRWDRHADDGFAWWIDRLSTYFSHADVLRIDHFIGYINFYEIDASAPDAADGVWLSGPGIPFFEAMEERLGPLQLIVEDLGPAGPAVVAAQKQLGYPGMRVVQDDFDKQISVPPIGSDVVAYTGTHDNNTARGRLDTESDGYRNDALSWSGASDADGFPSAFVERVWESDSLIAVAPVQDLLGLGAQARMNTPGTVNGNWQWRMPEGAASPDLATRLSELNQATGRHT